jgi:small neutral amino acid transporter SnatA (MarC family)
MFRGLCYSNRWLLSALYPMAMPYMREPDAISVAARATTPAGYRGDAPVGLVCLALVLALVALALRIAAIW